MYSLGGIYFVVSNSSSLLLENLYRCEFLLVSVQFKIFLILMSLFVCFFNENDLKFKSWMENILLMFKCVNLVFIFIFGFILFPNENDIDGIGLSWWKQRKEETG